MIKKAVIPVAGLGTRLLPATKEQPKEMLPVFAGGANGQECVKPLLQLVFEQLYSSGLREFCFVIGRGKRAIEDHFTPEHGYAEWLKSKGKNATAKDLENFYRQIEESTIIWVNQPEPKGFGDAVLKARSFTGNEKFIVHAGDTYIISRRNAYLSRLTNVDQKLDADATFIVQEVEDTKQYGVIEFDETGERELKVKRAVEKPEKPPSKFAIMPIYAFRPIIFRALERTSPGKDGEIQLTDAIQMLIDWGLKVYAIELKPEEIRLDIGTPDTYWDALRLSYQYATSKKVQFE